MQSCTQINLSAEFDDESSIYLKTHSQKSGEKDNKYITHLERTLNPSLVCKNWTISTQKQFSETSLLSLTHQKQWVLPRRNDILNTVVPSDVAKPMQLINSFHTPIASLCYPFASLCDWCTISGNIGMWYTRWIEIWWWDRKICKTSSLWPDPHQFPETDPHRQTRPICPFHPQTSCHQTSSTTIGTDVSWLPPHLATVPSCVHHIKQHIWHRKAQESDGNLMEIWMEIYCSTKLHVQ